MWRDGFRFGRRPVLALLAGGIVLGASLLLPGAGQQDFAFAADGWAAPVMRYRCEVADSPEKTADRAAAAHAFFAAALAALARDEGKALDGIMGAHTDSTSAIPQLRATLDSFEAQRQALHRQMEQRYACRYRGSR